ncbi:dihydrofolate reductase [Halorubrum sp. AJ67]|uniref:dihydrofolate reductase n=1 Tax=Halorubrum sp. AJ67 TaxID=1173487 RepID=UPI0003DD1AEF|nr:dihydrofolate reductase [Halorubrum sp. AJ67]CDK38117.1 dihydrofolate reductase [Halorubrum sp. AJ67]
MSTDKVNARRAECEWVHIAAVAENGVIGSDGGIPWDLPEDMERFKAETMGHPVVLGRKTYENIADGLGGPLPGRFNVVLSSSDVGGPESVVTVHDVDSAIAAAEARADETGVGRCFVAGGSSVYEQLLPMADMLLLTEVHMEVDGESRFPEITAGDWTEVSRQGHGRYDFVEYRAV